MTDEEEAIAAFIAYFFFILLLYDNMTEETCPVCGGKGEVIVSCLINRDGSVKPITVFQCSACDGVGVKR